MMPITLDARRLLCPMPVIRLQDAVANLRAGTQIKLLCNDRGVLHDIPAWCRINGHRVLETKQQADLIEFLLQVGETS